MGKDAGRKQDMTREKEIPKQTIIWPIDYAFGSLVCMLGFVADGVDWTGPVPQFTCQHHGGEFCSAFMVSLDQ